MPFGMGAEESSFFLVGIAFSLLPIVLLVWGIWTLTVIRREQTEILTRLKALERRLGG